MDGWMAWLGLDLSQNITPPRAPCGANNVERFQWQNNNGSSELGAAPPTTEPGVGQTNISIALFCHAPVSIRHQIHHHKESELQVDMLSMLHGATPSYENLGGMFPGQYQ